MHIPNFRRFFLASLVFVLAACQGTSATEKPNNQTAPTPVVSLTAGSPEPTGAQPTEIQISGLTGLVFSASDVSGQPDEPLADQLVLAVPVEKAGEVLGTGDEPLTAEVLRFLKADLLQANPAMAATLSDAGGKYSLLLDPGEYVLCLADSESTPPAFPARTRGCGLTQVMPGELRQVDISSGFGEILLVE